MLPSLPLPRHPATLTAAAIGTVSVLALGLWALVRRRPTREELEVRRRRSLSATGRIVDGALTGATPDEHAPEVIQYRYRVAGVTYECAQDVSTISPAPHDLRLEFPIQVRYNRANPGDSIVVADEWNGLWSVDRTPYQRDSAARPTRVESQ